MSRNVPHRRNKLVYVDDPSPYSTTMAGDNTAAWEQRSRPLVAFLRTGGKTLGEIKAWARASDHMVSVVEESLWWLLAQDRVVRELGVWRVVARG